MHHICSTSHCYVNGNKFSLANRLTTDSDLCTHDDHSEFTSKINISTCFKNIHFYGEVLFSPSLRTRNMRPF